MNTFLSALKKRALGAPRAMQSRKPMSDNAALATLVIGTVGLLITIAALNGGTAPTASAWDGVKTYLTSLLSSSWVLVLAFIALVAAVWQIAHGKGYGAVGLILGILSVALIGPGVVTAAATATRSPLAIESPTNATSPVVVALPRNALHS